MRCNLLLRSIGLLCFCAIFGLSFSSATFAAEPKSFDKPLWESDAPGALGKEPKDTPIVMVRLPASQKPTGALIICPGGGYGGLAMDHEGHQIAAWANEMGLAAIICDYRHRGKGYGHPAPMLDAQRAVRMTRHHASEWNIDPKRVGIIGFSAGGHLVSTVLTHFDAGDAQSADPIAQQSSRPDYGILCYPVIMFGRPEVHKGSERNLLGDNPDKDLLESLANDKQVTSSTPPTFIMHTMEDKAVPVQNAMAFYNAMIANNVPGELHIYQNGPHGIGLAKKLPGASAWPEACHQWLKNNKFAD